MDETIASVLHISDLHFVRDLFATGNYSWVNIPERLRGTPVEYAGGQKSHAYLKVQALAAMVQEFQLESPQVNLLVATGDLSTNGTVGAMRTARRVIEEEDLRFGFPTRAIEAGLGFPASRRILLPGNHDRYPFSTLPIQKPTARFERVFSTPTDYPYVVGYRDPSKETEVPALVFYVFDSTPSIHMYRKWRKGRIQNLVACGYIHPHERRWLRRESRRLRSRKTIPGIDGKELPIKADSVIQIVLLHHHPIPTAHGGQLDPNTMMHESDQFVDACLEAHIDAVLFGHDHISYPTHRDGKDGHRTYFFCCPTASEFTGPDTGFFLFEFRRHKFVMHEFVWDGSDFVYKEWTPHPYSR